MYVSPLSLSCRPFCDRHNVEITETYTCGHRVGIKTCSLDEKLSSNREYWIEVTANNFLIYKRKVKFTESGLVLI